ncbi:hypothetical protein [Actinophytocola gossypii]|uniref:AbrB/MazE/SpoVT family DNA-binding domain-containing protein n=1 Tax=Actinophytocola gossypii TaxID=2812003 RepID=A0ABT2JF24_9PSEU|nr:hypothetical protein [Actinophytocola gossypii]MCT2586316.1 hypothetical protein [Actinophytocola gossypii]
MTEPRWSVRCNDPFGRDRALTVLVENERIVLVPPPGAAAVLSAKQARGLGLALDQAQVRTVQDRVRNREAC